MGKAMNDATAEERLLVRFEGGRFHGDHYATRSALGWPPPPELEMGDQRYVLESHSQLTDEQMTGMTHVIRGALYRYSPEIEL